MDRYLIYNASIMTPAGCIAPGWLATQNQSIMMVGRGEPPDLESHTTIDAAGLTVLPGFIDLHVHGGNGYECMDASPDGIRTLAEFYGRHGVTGFLATTWTADRDSIISALSVIGGMVGPQSSGATLLGVHLEGPYLNLKYCGAQNPQQIRRANREEALAFLDTGLLKLVALAPEYEENQWLIRECVQRGITVSAAHTGATYEQIRAVVEIGLTQSTHTFNAMTGLHHRLPGTVGAVLDTPEIACELIADNVHVHPVVMRILLALKGIERIILITDAVRAAGMKVGSAYEQDGRRVTVGDNFAALEDGTLAGSALTMDNALRNFMEATRLPLEKAWQASSLNAARAIKLGHLKGSLEAGKDADLILVDEHINVHLTMAQGKIVYRKETDVAH